MKRFYFLFLTIMFLLTAGLGHSAEKKKEDISLPNPYVITYPFKSAIIYYNGKIEYGHGGGHDSGRGKIFTTTGPEIVYIKNGKLAKITKMTVSAPEGKTKNTESLRIITPDYVYVIDLVGKNGIKIDNSKKYGKVAYSKLSEEEKKAFNKRMERRGVVSLDLLGLGHKVGTDTILGRECDVYENGEKLSPEKIMEALQRGEYVFYMKTWVWKEAKIPLKIITQNVSSSSEVVATKIEENVKIPDSQFEVPSDVKITYDQQKSEASKQQTLARFNLYKTGLPMVYRVKAKKEPVGANPHDTSKSNKADQNVQGEDRKKHETDSGSNTYSERIYNYISNIFD